ncbi:hypothetical protein JYA63_14510 [Fictibacillus nanhaiensis]|uniref:Uncharacterized protein n=1 Tax=Fictibacillus nanhaiensis TaxID=742169 RepID=A0ABS2ZRK5_9BACL|nr:hypothetical protein [Fictibacillus nanhaiensis]
MVDEEFDRRQIKINRAFKLIKQGHYSKELGEFLSRIILEEQTIAGEHGLMFIDPELLNKYHYINERYLFGEPERIKHLASFKSNEIERKKFKEMYGI